MKKTMPRRIAALAAALAVVAGSAVSCNSKKEKQNVKSKDVKQLMSAAYRAVEIDTDVDIIENIYRLNDETILLTGRTKTDYSSVFYTTDNEFTAFNKWDLDIKAPENAGSDMRCSVANDGEIMILATFYEYGGDPELYEDDKDADSADDAKDKDDEAKADAEADGEKDKAEEKKEDASEPATAADADKASEDTGSEKTDDSSEKTSGASEEAVSVEEADFDDYEDYKDDTKVTSTLYVVDIDGKIKSEKELSGLDEFEYGINDIIACGNGRAIAISYGMNGQEFFVLNADGTVGDKIDSDQMEYGGGVAPIDEKTLLLYGYGMTGGMKLELLDINTFKPTGEEIKFEESNNDILSGSFYAGSGDYRFYSSTSEGFYGIKTDGTSEKLIDWIDSDLGSGSISSFIPMENGDYIMAFQNYMNGDSTLYRLTKRDASELENMKVMTIASLGGSWDLNEQVSAFNKAHDDIRFKVIDYSKYDEYDEETYALKVSGEDQFKKDIVAGDVPDMVVSTGTASIMALANKDLFVDMYEYLNKDTELKKDDILPNVLRAGEYKGKLITISPQFSVSTVAAKKKNADKANWTVDDLISTYENRSNKDMHLMGNDTKDSVLDLLAGSLGNCIDYEKGTCSFDDPEFKKLLTFCDSFGASKIFDEDGKISVDEDYSNEMQEYYGGAAFKKDKVLLQTIDFSYPEGIVDAMNGTLAGEDVTFVGFPSNDGMGGVMSVYTNYAIFSTSENKDSCWEFIKSFFNESTEEEDDNGGYSFGFSSYKPKFEKELDKCMSKPSYNDPETGKKVEYEYSYYDGNNSVEISPLTKEQRDFIADYIMNSTKISNDFSADIQNIITEEAMAYMKGEKSADEIAGNLQSRISLILGERN